MSDLDKLKGGKPVKDYDLKTLKAKSNNLVALALAEMEKYMNSTEIPNKDKAAMGFKILQNHIVILDKVEKLEFLRLNKSNLVLKNNFLLRRSLEDGDDGYKKLTEDDIEPSLDLGGEYLLQGNKSVN